MGTTDFDAGDLESVALSARKQALAAKESFGAFHFRGDSIGLLCSLCPKVPGAPGSPRIAVDVGALGGGRDDADLVVLSPSSVLFLRVLGYIGGKKG